MRMIGKEERLGSIVRRLGRRLASAEGGFDESTAKHTNVRVMRVMDCLWDYLEDVEYESVKAELGRLGI